MKRNLNVIKDLFFQFAMSVVEYYVPFIKRCIHVLRVSAYSYLEKLNPYHL